MCSGHLSEFLHLASIGVASFGVFSAFSCSLKVLLAEAVMLRFLLVVDTDAVINVDAVAIVVVVFISCY